VGGGDQRRAPVLGRVQILELVDEDVPEAPADGGAQPVVGLERDHGIAQQVVEVERRRDPLGRLVGGERFAQRRGPLPRSRAVRRSEPFGPRARVRAHKRAHCTRGDRGEGGVDVVLVPDREARGAAEARGLAAQDTGGEAVAGAHPHAPRDAVAEGRGQTVADLAGGVVHERHGADRNGAPPAGRNQPGDAGGQDAGLAGARAGDDRQRAAGVGGGRALVAVEGVEQRVGRHDRFPPSVRVYGRRAAGRCAPGRVALAIRRRGPARGRGP
jgi:hypothetical protein